LVINTWTGMYKLSPGLIDNAVLFLLIRLILFSGLIFIVPSSGTALLFTSFKVRSTSSSLDALTSGLEGTKTIVESFDCALSSTELKMENDKNTKKRATENTSGFILNPERSLFRQNGLHKKSDILFFTLKILKNLFDF